MKRKRHGTGVIFLGYAFDCDACDAFVLIDVYARACNADSRRSVTSVTLGHHPKEINNLTKTLMTLNFGTFRSVTISGRPKPASPNRIGNYDRHRATARFPFPPRGSFVALSAGGLNDTRVGRAIRVWVLIPT